MNFKPKSTSIIQNNQKLPIVKPSDEATIVEFPN